MLFTSDFRLLKHPTVGRSRSAKVTIKAILIRAKSRYIESRNDGANFTAQTTAIRWTSPTEFWLLDSAAHLLRNIF